MDFLIIGLSGFIGSILRYGFNLAEKAFFGSHFPMATLMVNIFGCFLSGIFIGLQSKVSPSSTQLLQLISIGFIGSFTTFSTFSAETIKLFESNFQLQAYLNVILNLALGFSFFIFGRFILK